MKKTFKFDVILDEADMCNREAEKARLTNIMKRGGRAVVYSVRRMGKTSLLSVCSKRLKTSDPKSFHLYVDLNEVASLSDVAARFRSHYELALKEQLPLQNVKSLLSALLSRIKVGIPGGIELSLEKLAIEKPEQYLMTLAQELGKMSKSQQVVIIVDEFQGIADIKEAQAILRREFQHLSKASIILMGSNQRLLYKIFNDKKLPFFGFGEDIELGNIPVKDYLPYMNERFALSNISISEEVAVYMMDRLNNIPNYINELCSWIVDTQSGIELTKEHVDISLESASRSKRGRYVSALYGYTENQKKLIKAVARIGKVDAITGKEVMDVSGLSVTQLSRAKAQLEDSPLLCRDTENNIFILDPFLKNFLEML